MRGVAIASVRTPVRIPPRHAAHYAAHSAVRETRSLSHRSASRPRPHRPARPRYSPPSGRFTSQLYPRPAPPPGGGQLPGRERGRHRKIDRRPRWWPCRPWSVSSRVASSPTRSSIPRSTARQRACHARRCTAIARMIRARQHQQDDNKKRVPATCSAGGLCGSRAGADASSTTNRAAPAGAVRDGRTYRE